MDGEKININTHPIYIKLVEIANSHGADIEWRFYKDGGWLGKGTFGKKTAFWVALDKSFIVSFHFSHKAFYGLENLTLGYDTWQMMNTADKTKRLITLQFQINGDSLPEDIAKLIAYKKNEK